MVNFQAVVSQFFEWQTSLVVRWPLPFLLFPPLITIALTSLAFSDLHLNVSNDTLRVFLPDDIQALRELEEDAMRDSYSIFGTSFVYWIYEAKSGKCFYKVIICPVDSAIEPSGLTDMARLHGEVKKMGVGGLSFSTVCLSSSLSPGCSLHPLAFALEDSDPVLSSQFLLRYPLLLFSNITIDNAVVFGGVSTRNGTGDNHGNYAIDTAKAVRMIYTLQMGKDSERWMNEFLSRMPSLVKEFPKATVHFTSSASLAKEMERNGHLLVPWMPWMCLVLVVFCMLICSSWDVVKSQPWVGFFAMLNATMATVASTSLLLYLRYSFLPLVFIMPFLVISIGTDNMFLMLKSWRMGRAEDVEQRFVDALTETAASLFLTSLTDGLSFSIGSISSFHAVRVFCTYCAMAILFMFFYQISFFNAIMVLCCRREVAGRHSLFCYRVDGKAPEGLPSSPRPSSPLSSLLTRLLSPWPSRLFVLLLYLVYIVLSVNYSMQLPLGLDLKLLAPDDSYVARELDAQERLYKDYGSFCFGVIKTHDIDLGEPLERRRLTMLYSRMANGSSLASAAEFWLVDFERENEGRAMDQREFLTRLIAFLDLPEYNKYKNDIRFSLRGSVEAVKFILRVRDLSPSHDDPRALFLRETFAHSGLEGFVYDTSFLLVDQQGTTISNVVGNVITAVATMLVICVLMVPRLACSLCIALAILSINIGVVGALAAVSTRLDIISMITIVMSVGFSVDYVVHTTFHFVTQRGDRLRKCLEVMVEPILQSALSTAVGVALLAVVPSYIVRTFVFTVLFVVAIGVLHGLVFLPALLISVVPDSEYLDPYSHHSPVTPLHSSRITAHRTPHHPPRLGCYSSSPPAQYDLPSGSVSLPSSPPPPPPLPNDISSPPSSANSQHGLLVVSTIHAQLDLLPSSPLPPSPLYSSVPLYHPIVKPRSTVPARTSNL